MLEYRSYAKINLFLDVRDRRDDGFTNIETIFQTVSLHDTLTVAPCDDRVSLTCSNPDLETDDGNLVCRTAKLLQDETGVKSGARMHLDKQVPIAAGLAGGSGNAAAALVALNDLWGLNLPPERMRELGLRLGSDVPYCLEGGTRAATGRGEQLTPLTPVESCAFLLLHPPIAVSTAAVYRSDDLTRNTEEPVDGQTPTFRDAIETLASGDVAGTLFNRMESAAFVMHPELAEWKQRLIDAGCDAAIMSGSGPTLFGVCATPEYAESLRAAFPDLESTVVRPVEHGVERIA